MLTLAVQEAPLSFTPPGQAELLALLPPPPARAPAHFQPPRGLRRRLALLLALIGVALMAMPLLFGHIPDHPAGLPLALLTLALLVGIRARLAGFLGSFCIWLVPNLPSFRHGAHLHALWPALPLLVGGLILLGLDHHVRLMWVWLRRQLGGGP